MGSPTAVAQQLGHATTLSSKCCRSATEAWAPATDSGSRDASPSPPSAWATTVRPALWPVPYLPRRGHGLRGTRHGPAGNPWAPVVLERSIRRAALCPGSPALVPRRWRGRPRAGVGRCSAVQAPSRDRHRAGHPQERRVGRAVRDRCSCLTPPGVICASRGDGFRVHPTPSSRILGLVFPAGKSEPPLHAKDAVAPPPSRAPPATRQPLRGTPELPNPRVLPGLNQRHSRKGAVLPGPATLSAAPWTPQVTSQ